MYHNRYPARWTLPKIRTAPSQLRLAAKYHARAELIGGDPTKYFDLVNLHCRILEPLFPFQI